jgi:hypothetical protein
MVNLNSKNPTPTVVVTVTLQNRGAHAEIIPDAAALNQMLRLQVEALQTPACTPAPQVSLDTAKMKFPLTIQTKKNLVATYDVTFFCANDPARSTSRDPGHEDYRYQVTVNHAALDGKADDHPADDVCPRSVRPPFELDPNPDGKIKDYGCGKKKPDGTFGAEAVTDIVVR